MPGFILLITKNQNKDYSEQYQTTVGVNKTLLKTWETVCWPLHLNFKK